MKNLLLILFVSFFGHLVAQDNINIPDQNFKKFLIEEVMLDHNNDGEISKSEALSATSLNIYISDKNLTSLDLTGIEEFTNLVNLMCGSNHVTKLNVSTLVNLENLDCSNNDIAILDVTNLIKLKTLDCSMNSSLSSLNISNLALLENLNCSMNSISSLSVPSNINLKTLDCSGNSGLSALNLSNLPKFTSLTCSEGIENMNLLNLPELENLNCSTGSLLKLDVTNLAKLKTLNCSNNYQLKELKLSNLPLLTSLNCSQGQLQVLNLSSLPSLTNINCSENALYQLDIANGINNNTGFSVNVLNQSRVGWYVLCINHDEGATITDKWQKDDIASWSTTCPISDTPVYCPIENFTAQEVGKDAVLEWNSWEDCKISKFHVKRKSKNDPTYRIIARIDFSSTSTYRSPTANLYRYSDTGIGENDSDVEYTIEQVNSDNTTLESDNNPVVFRASESVVLPVEIALFSVQKVEENVQLSWVTSTEVNNSHFEIQRSYNGVNYESIGSVAGKGNSSVDVEYEYIDTSFERNNERIYYRLKQVDYDGVVQLFDVEYVQFDKNEQLIIYPTQVISGTDITIKGDVHSIRIYNTIGEVILNKTYEDDTDIIINTTGFSTGMYFINLNNQSTKKILVK